MSGCYGGGRYDRRMESELNDYLDSLEWEPCKSCNRVDLCSSREACSIDKVQEYLETRFARSLDKT